MPKPYEILQGFMCFVTLLLFSNSLQGSVSRDLKSLVQGKGLSCDHRVQRQLYTQGPHLCEQSHVRDSVLLHPNDPGSRSTFTPIKISLVIQCAQLGMGAKGRSGLS